MILHKAMKGLGTRERLIYPVICSRDNDEIVKLKATFFEMYSQDLGIKLASELGGDFERMIFWSLQGLEKPFDPDYFTQERAEADAEAFFKGGQGHWAPTKHLSSR